MINLEIFKFTGILAAVWMFVGVALVARQFPGYSHTQQVMSELGAVGRPTARIHPLVNNFPLAVLFTIFGLSVTVGFWANWQLVLIGFLLSIHGVCHLVTGMFPCDEDLGIPTPSVTQIVHNVAGLVMFVTLLTASLMGVFLSSVLAPVWFRWLSLSCLIVSMIFLFLMAKSFSSGHHIGLYQRISYGVLVLWAAVFSGISYNFT